MEINKAQPKKQVRRRLHTSKPYQERLLNMAEARREIATALKFHRASMRQQNQTPANHVPNSTAPTATPTANNHWPMPPPLVQENLDLVLPNQTLGLNLNFKDFNNLNTSIYYNPIPPVSGGKEVGVVNSARSSLDMNEVGAKQDGKKDGNCYEDGGYYDHPFEEVMEFPPWLINGNENSTCGHHLLDHHFSDEYSPDPDPALPCMDIGEIEGMDGEWLA
ncbi:hypothetical protein SSX86_026389 [Deinandra increscens subsp. villosa]|uniref:Uncharacterized protein n=1 Tax=Deinandra increscens subsp. villosa TaxID=3103831 RepID=A0AAP0CJH6_9ASTR